MFKVIWILKIKFYQYVKKLGVCIIIKLYILNLRVIFNFSEN